MNRFARTGDPSFLERRFWPACDPPTNRRVSKYYGVRQDLCAIGEAKGDLY